MTTTIEVPDLLGDSIYSSFFVRRYIETHPDERVEILLSRDTWCKDIWHGVTGVKNVTVKDPNRQPEGQLLRIDLGRAFGLCVGKYHGDRPFWHTISEDMGLATDDMLVPPINLQNHTHDLRRGLRHRVLLSPYSASCGSQSGQPANKMLSVSHWQSVFDLVHGMWMSGWIGKPLFIGGPGEQLLPDVLPEYEMLGAPFQKVVDVVRSAQCIIGVDTGTIRLANMLRVQAFFTTPVGLGKMFIPNWGGFVAHETGHPQSYTPHQFRDFVERCVKSRL